MKTEPLLHVTGHATGGFLHCDGISRVSRHVSGTFGLSRGSPR